MSTPGFVVLVGGLVLIGVVTAGWVGWTGCRLRRLERRVGRARQRLVTELVRRRAVVAECLATERRLPSATRELLLGLIARARAADTDGFDVEAAESALTRALATALSTHSGAAVTHVVGESGATDVERWRAALVVATRRVHFARRFHNDLVLAWRELRRHRGVRWWWPLATGPVCLEQLDDPTLLEAGGWTRVGSTDRELDQYAD